jgi:hypothetical protein
MRYRGQRTVAHALMRAASALVPTPFSELT